MKVAPRIAAVLVPGTRILSGAWDRADANAERPDTVTSLDLGTTPPLSGQPDVVAGPSAEADETGTFLPILTGVCIMMALCCIVLLMSSLSPLSDGADRSRSVGPP